jgi:hypothetical protein
MRFRTFAAGAFAALAFALALPVYGQVVFVPPNVLLPNNEGLPVGALGGLEGNAFTARVADSTAGWFNTAGLAAATDSSASVSAGTFRFVNVSNDASSDSNGSSVTQIPAAVGFVLKRAFRRDDLTLGFSVARTAAWGQTTEAQFLLPGAKTSYTTFAADAMFSRTTIAIAAGWNPGGAWKFGAGLLGDVLSLRSIQALSNRADTGGPIRTAVASSRATGGQGSLRLSLGAQADLSSDWKLGATVRTPGVRIVPSGVFAVDAVNQNGAASEQVSFFDAGADFRYKLPFEVALGLAWVRPTFEIEVDVKGQTGVSAYSGFASTHAVLRISDAGTGAAPAVSTTPFPGVTFESRAIVNVSLGGHLSLDRKGRWKLHAGFATDRSPVGDADRFFNRTDLTNVTVGVSGTAFHIAGSLGLTYEFGTTDKLTVPDLAGGVFARTTYKISNFGILYSASYVF